MPTCYPYQTYYCRCCSAAAHKRVCFRPVIHIGLLPLLISCCSQKSRLPTCYLHRIDYCRCCSAAAQRRVVIHIGHIIATVDQLLHTEEEVAYLLSTSYILPLLLISCCTHKSRLPNCHPHQTYLLLLLVSCCTEENRVPTSYPNRTYYCRC